VCRLASVMWIPGNVDEIEAAITRGDLEETSSFDGKREPPPSTKKGNASIAEDVAAMSTAGGTILYGVGEDEDKRLTVRNPIPLADLSDRISNIVQSSIAEVPHYEFRPYALLDNPATGFLLVVVPPSPRAPHQVTVGDDRRFYGRAARGNRRLGEQEIALLYARRQQHEVDLGARLDEAIAYSPFETEGHDKGVLYAFAQPVPPDDGVWDRAVERAGDRTALQLLIANAARPQLTTQGYDPSFSDRIYWHDNGADSYRLSTQPDPEPEPKFATYLGDMTFNIDGRAVLFAGNAARGFGDKGPDPEARKFIHEQGIAGNLAAFFSSFAVLMEQASYYGAVDVGLRVTNLRDGIGVGRHEHLHDRAGVYIDWESVPRYKGDAFTRVKRLAAISELDDPQVVVMGLLGRLFAGTTGRDDYSPFASG
jgi:hypothetical protein